MATPRKPRKPRPYTTWSEKDKARHREKVKAKRRGRINRLSDFKAAAACARCGFSHPAALHFHHIRDKVGNVNRMARSISNLATVLAEVEKCIVLCANCHAVEHWEQRRVPPND